MSKDNVTVLDVVTSLPIPVDRVLDKARDGSLSSVVVIGWDEDGDFWFASSEASGPEVLWLLELTKKKLLEIADE